MNDTEKPSSRERAQAALKQATKAANRGDQREAERWLKTAERMAAAAERIAALPKPEVEDVEAVRAELRDRVYRFAPMAQEIAAWEHQRDIRDALAAFARAHDLPEPPGLEPCRFNDDDLAAVGAGTYTPPPRDTPVLPILARRQLGLPEDEVFPPVPGAPGSNGPEKLKLRNY